MVVVSSVALRLLHRKVVSWDCVTLWSNGLCSRLVWLIGPFRLHNGSRFLVLKSILFKKRTVRGRHQIEDKVG